jgi:hypothetical protein
MLIQNPVKLTSCPFGKRVCVSLASSALGP